ncbi:MAG TPA: tRNA (adenosine(37)-N6)-threonylcarbamoyltransferase complex dimerization subunit type 1 TsaB [Acetobacteraceae bacterium]|jgi:tRNA threonylcarbamoyladenosine biosynthesis protein TsaB|nr:tRNA (adenosine(37)-N6)-threonylcarbamoyltransferase complex dimerization subunit type 1 TsaB [Acetobacteraceae bacterium]
MLVLALDSALAQCSAAIVADGFLRAARVRPAQQGHAVLLPVLADEVLHETGTEAPMLNLIAVTVGPGSFTGIRAGLALAHGIALGANVPMVGVTVGEALADSLPHLGIRRLWTAIDSRRGRVFLERDRAVTACDLDSLPIPAHPVAIAGDAAIAVAARLAAQGADVMLTDARLPTPRHIAVSGIRRLAGGLPPLPAQPLYVDPPEARLPAGGLRPPPVAA